MKNTFQTIHSLHQSAEGSIVELRGWVAGRRDSKGLCFVVFRDGSGYCQCVFSQEDLGEEIFEQTKSFSLESSLIVRGSLHFDERQEGGKEIQVQSFELVGVSEEYPISKKAHGTDFLLSQRHLWLRSKRQWAIMQIRNATIFAIHKFFQEREFVQMDAPILSSNAAENSTELFATEYFDRSAFLSQSGQLYGEAMAMAQGKIYTFGPTFRAEKSKTRRHLTEFWMMEPEMAFYDLDMNMDLIEEMLRYVVNDVMDRCPEAFQVLGRNLDMLQSVNQIFPRIPYDLAVQILRSEVDVNGMTAKAYLEGEIEKEVARQKEVVLEIEEREAAANDMNSKKGVRNFNRNKADSLKNDLKQIEENLRNYPKWLESASNFIHGEDFGGSDETVLTMLYGCPIMVYRWPKAIKAFYMKVDPDYPDYAKGIDVLAPEGYGEIVGGGERETDIDYLLEQIERHDLPQNAYEWYLDLRRYGNVPHSGFGLGLERLLCWICKLDHIREAIPFPRTSQRLEP